MRSGAWFAAIVAFWNGHYFVVGAAFALDQRRPCARSTRRARGVARRYATPPPDALRHRHDAEAAPPKMAGLLLPRVNAPVSSQFCALSCLDGAFPSRRL